MSTLDWVKPGPTGLSLNVCGDGVGYFVFKIFFLERIRADRESFFFVECIFKSKCRWWMETLDYSNLICNSLSKNFQINSCFQLLHSQKATI